MPLLIIALVIALIIFVIRLIIVLFTRPVDALAMLTSWALNIVGIFGVGIAAIGTGYAVFSDDVHWDAELIGVVILAGGVAIVAFSVSSWLGRVRLRREYRRHADAQFAAYDAAAREHQRRYR